MQDLVARCPGVEVLSSARPGGHPAVRLCARPFRLPRPAVAAGHRRTGDDADARLRRAAEGRRVHPRLPGRETAAASQCRSPKFCRATAATWPIVGWRSMSGKFRDFLREHGETPEEQELIAAKLMGRWRSGAPLVLAPGQGRSGARGRSAAQQRLQLQGDGPARLCGAARLAHPAHEPARHGART